MRQHFKDIPSVLKEWRERKNVTSIRITDISYVIFVTGKVYRCTNFTEQRLITLTDENGFKIRIIDDYTNVEIKCGDKLWVKGLAKFSDFSGFYIESKVIQTNRY